MNSGQIKRIKLEVEKCVTFYLLPLTRIDWYNNYTRDVYVIRLQVLSKSIQMLPFRAIYVTLYFASSLLM